MTLPKNGCGPVLRQEKLLVKRHIRGNLVDLPTTACWSVSFLLRSLGPGLVLLLLVLLFLFRQLLLFAFFLVLLATLVSHACSFSAIMTRHGE